MGKITILEDRDTDFMILAGIRYAIRRSSYAPWLVTDWVKRHWNELESGLQKMIKRDIISEIDMWARSKELSLGMDCDAKTWRDFAKWLVAQEMLKKKSEKEDCPNCQQWAAVCIGDYCPSCGGSL